MAIKTEIREESPENESSLSNEGIRDPLEDKSSEKKRVDHGKDQFGRLIEGLKIDAKDDNGEDEKEKPLDIEKREIDPKYLEILNKITEDEQYQTRILEEVEKRISAGSIYCMPLELLQKITSLPENYYKDERDITLPFDFFEGSPLEFFENVTIREAEELLVEFVDPLLAMKAYFDCKGKVKKIFKYRKIALADGRKYDSEDIRDFIDNMISPRIVKKYIREGIQNCQEILNYVNQRIRPKKAAKLQERKKI